MRAEKEGGAMKYTAAIATLLCALLVAAPAADAQNVTFVVVYPDNSQSFNFNLGFGQNAVLFWDLAGDADMFVHTANANGIPFFVSVGGIFVGIAFWLDFQGFVGSRMLFNVWAVSTTGVPFAPIGQFLL